MIILVWLCIYRDFMLHNLYEQNCAMYTIKWKSKQQKAKWFLFSGSLHFNKQNDISRNKSSIDYEYAMCFNREEILSRRKDMMLENKTEF
jgi:hypothetical protein